VTETDLIQIRSFTNEMEAEIAKSALDAFGIECMISRDDCGGQRPHLAFSGGIRLLVRADDAERAEEVLKGGGVEDSIQ
jgi:Putative prokaryotic signal transducing protein